MNAEHVRARIGIAPSTELQGKLKPGMNDLIVDGPNPNIEAFAHEFALKNDQYGTIVAHMGQGSVPVATLNLRDIPHSNWEGVAQTFANLSKKFGGHIRYTKHGQDAEIFLVSNYEKEARVVRLVNGMRDANHIVDNVQFSKSPSSHGRPLRPR